MKKRIIFGSILAIFLLLSVPCISGMHSQIKSKESFDNNEAPIKGLSGNYADIQLRLMDEFQILVDGVEKDVKDLEFEKTYKNVVMKGNITSDEIPSWAITFTGIFSTLLVSIIVQIVQAILKIKNIDLYKIIFRLPGVQKIETGKFEITIDAMSNFLILDRKYGLSVGFSARGVGIQ